MSMMEWAKREVEIASKRERGDKAMIDQCDAIYVLLHSENSVGTKKEIEYAKSTCKQVIYQQEAETKEKEWGWKKDPYIYPRSFYSPVGYTPRDPWGRRL